MTPNLKPAGTQKKKKGAPRQIPGPGHDCIILVARDNRPYVDRINCEVFGSSDTRCVK